MKKLLMTIFIIVSVLSVQAQKGFVIEGNIAGLPDDVVKLKKIYNGNVLYETNSKDGIFVFKKDNNVIGDKVYLECGGKYYCTFYMEPGKIKLVGEAAKPTEIKATGTPSNDAQNKYAEAIAPIEKKIALIRAELKTVKGATAKEKLMKDLAYQYDSLFYPTRKAFAKKYNNTIMAAEFLSAGTGQLTYSDFKTLLASLDQNTPENWYTDRLKERCEVLRKTDFGQVVPDFTLPDPDGKMITLSSLKGKIVLVDFWASWCGPCRAENKNLLKLYEKYNKQGFTVIGVSIDDNKEKWVQAIQQDKLPWYHVSSLVGWDCPVAHSLGVAYGMSGVPYNLLLDRENRTIGHNVMGEDLENKLKEIFKN